MISRYLVINDDLLCNVFTLQSVWIHYKENRYPLTGITVFNAQNCGIHQSGITVLCFRNDGSESSGILKRKGKKPQPAGSKAPFRRHIAERKTGRPQRAACPVPSVLCTEKPDRGSLRQS